MLGEVGEVVDAAGQPFGQAAEQRERAERHDQGGNAAARDQEAVQAARQAAQDQGRGRGRADRQPTVAPELAEDDGREAHQRPDRQVDAAAGDHRRQGHGQEADLDARAAAPRRRWPATGSWCRSPRRPRSRAPEAPPG